LSAASHIRSGNRPWEVETVAIYLVSAVGLLIRRVVWSRIGT
jgi:hypothetical protein